MTAPCRLRSRPVLLRRRQHDPRGRRGQPARRRPHRHGSPPRRYPQEAQDRGARRRHPRLSERGRPKYPYHPGARWVRPIHALEDALRDVDPTQPISEDEMP